MASLKQFLNDRSNKSEIDQYFDDQAKFLLEKKKLETIDNFNGYFDFLNNEFPCAVYHDGLIYKTVSHAFQAARSSEQHIREKIVRADTVMEMYEIAAKIDDPQDWMKIRLKVMETLVRDKFRRNPELREKLRATETRSLINTYSDPSISNLFWGMVDGKGQNQLGRIIENIRNDIHHNIELEKWLFMTFKLEENKSLQPKIQLDVIKGDSKIEAVNLEGKSYYFLGKLAGSDVLMTHQSISRRHAVLISDSQSGVCLVDLGSKGGSFLNNQKMDTNFPYRLKPGDMLHFGASTRRYKVAIDYSDVERFLLRKKREVKKQYEKMDTLNDPGANADALRATLGVVINDQIFVGGLPENTSYKELETLFSQYGEVKNVRIPTDRKTGKTKTFALITFKDPKECEKAIEADGLKYKERRLKIKMAEKRDDDYRRDEPDRDRYAKAVKENEDKLGKDVASRHKRRSRSPRDSRRRRDDRSRRDDRDRHRRDRSRSRDKKRSEKKKRSKSSSASSDESSKSRSREREKNKKDKEKKKDSGKDKKKDEGESKRKKSESESKSKSRSRSKDKDEKKNGANKKKLTRSQEKEAKNKDAKKKKAKSESESSSGSSSGSESDSSSDSGSKGK